MKKIGKRNVLMAQAIMCSLLLSGCATSHLTDQPSHRTMDVDSNETAWGSIPGGQMRIVVSTDDAYLYILQDSGMQGYLLILARKSYNLLHRIPVGRSPIAMATDGEIGYVVNYLSDDVTIVNLETAKAIKTLPVGHRPIRIMTWPASPYLFIANYGSDTVSVIDKKSLKTVKSLEIKSRPGDMAIHPNGRHVYVLHRGSGDLSVIDMTSLEVVQTVPVGGEFPSGIAVSEEGRFLFVSDAQSHTLQVIETERLIVVQEIPVGNRPMQVLQLPGAERVYVLNNESRTISVVDPAKQEETFVIPLKHSPRCMTASSDGKLYVSFGEDYEITVIEVNGRQPGAFQDVQVTF